MGSRQSAFAKRRRLNDGITTRGTDSDTSASPAPVDTARPDRGGSEHVTKEKPSTIPPKRKTPSEKDAVQATSENSFEPLVKSNAVKFSGAREIERLDEQTCKIRLSRGQKCPVYGAALLWIRDGTVLVYGALLHESPKAYHLFAPGPKSPAIIEARSKTAEFQLEDVSSLDSSQPSWLNLPGLRATRSQNNLLTFRVGGLETDDHLVDPGECNLPSPSQIDRAKRKSKPSDSGCSKDAPRILICGKRSVDTSAASVNLINQYLSLLADQVTERGVIFLDLDPDGPAFGWPGTISISKLRNLVLGPSYTFPISGQDHVKAFFLGSGGVSDASHPRMAMVAELLQATTDLEVVPLIIRTGTWLERLSQEDLAALQKAILPDLVICTDHSRSSPQLESTNTLAQSGSVELVHSPFTSKTETSSLANHRNTVQSHFRAHGCDTDLGSLWYAQALPHHRTLELSYADDALELSFFAVYGGALRSEDVFDALDDSLVTVVSSDGYPQHWITFSQTLRLGTIDPDGYPLLPLGPAYVEAVDEEKKQIKLNTKVEKSKIRECLAAGLHIGLALQKPLDDGRFGRHLLFQ